MKKVTLALLMSIGVLSGCATMGNSSSSAPFVGHEFSLVSVDGTMLTLTEARPQIAFAAVKDQPSQIAVSGSMCNNFFGQGTLKDNVLTVKPLGATMRFCSDQQLNQLDRVIGLIFEKGATIRLEGNRLHIEGDTHELIYNQK